VRAVLGDEVELVVMREMAPLEVPSESKLVSAIREGLSAADPKGVTLPYVMPGFTDGGAFSKLGITYYGFSPVFFPEEPKVAFADLYHGDDERIPVDGFHRGLECLYDVVKRFCAK
jgi:acetylornithine deacetylase/succinyl-diaminopimelate desuccinylase-like protein